MTTTVLNKEGYEVRAAENGMEGVRAATIWKPDIVLLDVMMPGMDGYETCRRLRQIPHMASIPIIMVTAKTTIEDKIRGYEVGADDYITKPFINEELLLRLKAHIRRASIAEKEKEVTTTRVIAVFSLRGGAGVSSLAVNTAVGLATLWQSPVVLLDLSTPVGACDLMLDTKPDYRLDTLVEQDFRDLDKDMIFDYLATHESGVRLLGGISNPVQAELLKEGHISTVLEHLDGPFPYIVVDTAHNFLGPTLTVLERADVILMPLTPDINSVRVTMTALRVFEQLGFGKERVLLVLNNPSANDGLDPRRIEKTLGLPISIRLKHADVWNKAINVGNPVIAQEDATETVETLQDLVWELSRPADKEQAPKETSRLWDNIQSRMKKKAARAVPVLEDEKAEEKQAEEPAREEPEVTAKPDSKGLNNVALQVEDIKTVSNWYVVRLGLAVVSQDDNSVTLAGQGGAALELRKGKPLDDPSRVSLAFHIEDFEVVYKRMGEGKLKRPKKVKGRSVVSMTDPAGHTVEIFSIDNRETDS
jgi:pilus assembly protein CpaE